MNNYDRGKPLEFVAWAACFILAVVLMVITYTNWLDDVTERLSVDVTPDQTIHLQTRMCEGYNVDHPSPGHIHMVWICSDGEVIYDPSGVRPPR